MSDQAPCRDYLSCGLGQWDGGELTDTKQDATVFTVAERAMDSGQSPFLKLHRNPQPHYSHSEKLRWFPGSS